MKNALLLAALLAAGLATGSAQASNGLYITNFGDHDLNSATATAEGSGNALWIAQTHDQSGAANTLSIDLHGDLNGGPTDTGFGDINGRPLGDVFGGLGGTIHLVPGRVEQTGAGNSIGMHVFGSSNLFAITQNGVGNTLTAMVNGNNNQAAVYQIGTGNALSYSQIGSGNMLSVVQRSR